VKREFFENLKHINTVIALKTYQNLTKDKIYKRAELVIDKFFRKRIEAERLKGICMVYRKKIQKI